MPPTWTQENILALAPDPGVAKSGKGLAVPRKWPVLGRNDQALWGECKGSAKVPYQVAVDLAGPAFKCNCSSHKRPCKHAVGLFLMVETLTHTSPPAWVKEWLAARAKRAEKLAQKTDEPAVDVAAQAERANERLAKVSAGIQELDLWLRDLVRRGLAEAQSQPSKFWETPAARLVDAQAPGLARFVRNLGSLPASGPGWQERLLERLGQLHLLLEGFKRIETLPPDTQADIRALIGWTRDKAELAGEPRLHDRWQVVGRRIEDEGRLRQQRLWLIGEQTGRQALILDYSVTNQTFETNLLPGTMLEADLVFFPGAYPLRAFLRQGQPGEAAGAAWPAHPSIAAALDTYTSALTRNPWLEHFPLAVQAVVPLRVESGWVVRDAAQHVLPIAPRFDHHWSLLALSGGRPLRVFGEWDGGALLPLSAVADGRFVSWK